MRKIDYHTHTSFSDGRIDVSSWIRKAAEMGLEELAITDHYDPWDGHLSNRNATDTELLRHFDRIHECAAKSGITVYAGIETCTGMDGKLRLSKEVLSRSELTITSPHYVDSPLLPSQGEYFCDAYWERYKKLLLAQAEGDGEVLGHPEGYLPVPSFAPEDDTFGKRQEVRARIAERYLDEDFYLGLASALKKSGKAFELHGATGTPRTWVVRLLAGEGVRFSIGSDAHDYPLLGKNERAWKLWDDLHLEIISPRSHVYG